MPPPPLPEGWSPSERVTDTVVIGGLTLHRAGVATIAPSGEELTGAAAALVEMPEDRAQYELRERVATFEAIARAEPFVLRDARGEAIGSAPSSLVFPRSEDEATYREARSNGVALHTSWTETAYRARAELVERDHVLRSWHGLEAPRRIDLPAEAAWPIPRQLSAYEWRAYAFEPSEPEAWSAGIAVCGVFGVPLREDLPFLAGYGGRSSLDLALLAAAAELTQSLAFLWGEELPTEPPPPAPHAGAHLEWTQYPPHRPLLLAWLDGEHRAHAPARVPVPRSEADAEVTYADLTPSWLVGHGHVARALHRRARRLVFGRSPGALHLPPTSRMHPIG